MSMNSSVPRQDKPEFIWRLLSRLKHQSGARGGDVDHEAQTQFCAVNGHYPGAISGETANVFAFVSWHFTIA
jgi:hypothetical protein